MAAAAVPRAARGALQVVGLDGRSAGARPLPVTGSYRAYSQELGVHVWNVEAPSGLADCGSWRVVVHRALCVGNDRESGGLVAGPPKDLTHGDQLSVTFRHFPMTEVHPHGQHAAEVAEAAATQGRFWEMHDMLLANQNALDDASLVKYAADLALDAERVRRELASHEHAGRVAEDRASGMTSGVRGTPTFYIDGARYDGSVALGQMLAAIRAQHPDLEVADTAATTARIPRVTWPRRPDA